MYIKSCFKASSELNVIMNISLDLASVNRLWQTVLESVGTLKINPSCQLFLKAWITNGVERMENEGRLTPKDVATANENLKTFIELMKAEALSRGTDRLDNKCFHAAQHKLERHSLLTVFSLWPFWPHAVGG
jgi:hypothetical protein